MDQSDYLLKLAAGVRQATLKRDFEALAQLNREVHDVATAMSTKRVLNASERESLALLKIAHRSACALLASESERLIGAMSELGSPRAGLEAYAIAQRSA